MSIRLFWPVLALLAAMLCLEGAVPARAGFDPNDYDPHYEGIGDTMGMGYGASCCYTDIHPGDKPRFFGYSSTCSGCPGHTHVVVTFPSWVTVEDDFYKQYQVGNSIVEDYDSEIGIFIAADMRVAPAASIPSDATELRYDIDATSVGGNGKTYHGHGSFALPLVGLPLRVSTRATTVHPNRVSAGEEVTWTVQAAPQNSGSNVSISDLLPSPKIGKVVPGSISDGGTQSGTKINWNFNNVSGLKSVSFKFKLNDPLPPNTTSLINKVSASASQSQHAEATASVPVAGSLAVGGIIRNLEMDFPKATVPYLKHPVANAHVMLVKKSDQSISDEVNTDAKGAYLVKADEAGDYFLEITSQADRYDKASNQVQKGVRNVTVRKDVTIPEGTTKPVEVDDLYLPLGLVNEVTKQIFTLNNQKVVLSPVANLAGVGENALNVNTASLEATLDQVVADAPEFKGIYRGTGDRDGWNALIRMDAAISMLNVQLDKDAKLMDAASKPLALFICLEVMKKFGDLIPKRIPSPLSKANQHGLNILKIGLLADGTPVLAQQVIEPVLTALGVPASQKALWIDVYAKAIRFGFALLIQKFEEDAVFEVAFTALRSLFIQLGEEVLVRGAGGYQEMVDNAANLAARKIYSDDTLPTLAGIERQNGILADGADQAINESNTALSIASLVRELDGTYFELKKIKAAGGPITNVNLGPVSSGMDSLLAKVTSPIAGAASRLGKVASWVKAKGVGSITQAATMTGITWAIGAPICAIALRTATVGPLVGQAFSGVTTSAASAGPAATSTGAWGAADSPGTAARGKKPPSLKPAVIAFLDVLGRVRAKVAANDAAGYAALEDELLDDDTALGAYLDGVNARLVASLPSLASKSAPTPLATFLNAQSTTGMARGLLFVMLEVWRANPTSTEGTPLLAQIDITAARVQAAGGAAFTAEQTLATLHPPATLIVTGEDNPITVVMGESVTMKYLVTNVGDAASVASTLTLDPDDGLGVQGPKTLPVPALAAGQSTEISWTVSALGSAGLSPHLEVRLDVPNSTAPTLLDDSLVITQ